jgi:hypothetical protein
MTKALGFAVLALFALAAPASAATTWYASPTGSGTTCTQVSPCTVQTVFDNASPIAAGDTVILDGGTYQVPTALEVHKKVSIEGAAGEAEPVLVGGPSTDITLAYDPASASGTVTHISGIEVTNEFATEGHALELVIGQDSDLITIDRVIAEASASADNAILLNGLVDARVLDSLAFATGTNSVALDVEGPNAANNEADLRNVTAVAPGSGSTGILFDPDVFSFMMGPAICIGSSATMKNTIARGGSPSSDIVAHDGTGILGPCSASVASSNSNWRGESGGNASDVTSTNDQHSVDPLFANAAGGDFHEAPGSPTIDAGSADPLNGPQDLDGQPRTLGAAPDIGAYESQRPAPVVPIGSKAPPPPVGSKLSFHPDAFAAAKRGGSIAVARGARVGFTLSEAATVTFTVKRPVKGRRKGKRCVTGKSAKRLHGKRCTTLKSLKHPFRFTGKAGANSFRFTGRVGHKPLRPGRYRLVGVGLDAGVKGKPFDGSFRIVKG